LTTTARLGKEVRPLPSSSRSIWRGTDAGALDKPPRHRLVVADRHRDPEVSSLSALAAADRSSAVGQPEEPARGVEHLDMDAAPARLVDDDRA
jgi:hypothetical protein